MTAIRAIHGALRQLGLDEATARDRYERTTGKRSLRLMSAAEQQAVLADLRRDLPARVKGLTGPYAKKLQALWIAGWNLGIVVDRTDAALLAFVARQSGIEDTRFLRDATDAKRAVEGLKAWLAREGGVRWGWSHGYDWLAHDAGKIAWAQWQKLVPEAQLIAHGNFYEAVLGILGLTTSGQPLGTLKPLDWRKVMNRLGEDIRKKGGAQ